ncbi:MAG: copper-binding protein, partial [Acidobacteriota bacterium]
MRLFIASAFLAVLALAGCHSSSQPRTESAADSNVKIYHMRGKIVASNPATGEITVDSEAIPGYMDAMVMPYKLKNPGIVSDLHPGDTITADVLVSQ